MTSTTRPKTPQDHKAPASSTEEITGTASGRQWVIPADALDDWELLEDLNDPTGASAPSAIRRLLGDGQYAEVKDLLRDPDTKRVSATAMTSFIEEFFADVQGNR